jgi:hypothetical protein
MFALAMSNCKPQIRSLSMPLTLWLDDSLPKTLHVWVNKVAKILIENELLSGGLAD